MPARRFPPPWSVEELGAPMMNNRNEDLNQPDEGDLLRDEVSDEAVEAAASIATGGLPTLWYSTHCFGCPSRPTLGSQIQGAQSGCHRSLLSLAGPHGDLGPTEGPTDGQERRASSKYHSGAALER